MNVRQLSERLSAGKQAEFMEAGAWQPAAREGLRWQNVAADARYVELAAGLLSNGARAVFRALLARYGPVPVLEEHLLREGPADARLSRAEFRCGMNELLQAGILLAARRSWGERYYFTVWDSFKVWRNCLLPCAVSPIADKDCRLEMAEEPAVPLGRQLLASWTELARCGLELTTKGQLAKRTVQKASQPLAAADVWLERLGSRGGETGISYPLGLALALEIASRMELIVPGQKRLVWQTEALSEWLAMPALIRESMLHEWCMLHLAYQKPQSAHAAAVLSSLEAGKWYEERKLTDHLLEMLHVLQHESWVKPISLNGWEEWLELLLAFGWLERAQSPAGSLLRWRIEPRSSQAAASLAASAGQLRSASIIVEPNGDVIAFPHSDFRLLWELELIGERVSSADRLTVYRLSAAATARALKQGRTLESILLFLQEASGTELPPLVRSCLEDWSSASGQNERVRKELESESESELFRSFPFLDASLEGGFHEGIPLGPSAGMLYNGWLEQHFELLEEDGMQQPFPELERVPVSWVKQFRAYHHSTKREMLERALSWHSPVQLKIEGDLLAFVPDKLEQDASGWTVSGLLREEQLQRQVTLTPDMWEEMKLVLPGMDGFL
ncbi:helicase-associated domain-containing protein [Paenibacillus radicis (ex Gao et al. 2016)]|uniref:Helicase XPB/Ssl2 N-terminal domain-containing protein n=1 Tax=Paenibacillus radicis (ex Gao et al. 2016) TaxID=1737354 RepID=A0A917HUD6_9BACL|nr:helicase-associated domain-containing protein [Paenibacillus radicis (ex Gao et al. 2016)]GGG89482.1 hypothetical protein GCM10010918_55320 [Paenibacillus radicis (ex Gao et al. 2016)]